MTLTHGGNIYHYSKKYGIPLYGITDFSASINPLGPSPRALAALRNAAGALDSYPDPDCGMLIRTLSEHHAVKGGSLLAGNGSTELIYLLPRVLRPDNVLVISPGFSDYERAARIAGARVRRITLKEKDGFMPNIGKLVSCLPGCDMLYLCNPNNPTGVLLEKNAVLDVMKAARKADCFVVVDEAFIDYAPDRSVIREAAAHRGVAVLRNFTKFFGLPGLRIGYVAAKPSLINKLKSAQDPWSVNALAQAAAAASLSDSGYIKRSLKLVDKEKRFLYERLSSIGGVHAYPPSVNFMLVRLDRGTGSAALAEGLASRGVLVRDCSNFRGLDGRFVRVAVRTRKQNEMLLAEIMRSEYFTAG